jgi:hypothetical protein
LKKSKYITFLNQKVMLSDKKKSENKIHHELFMAVKIHILALWVIKQRRVEDGYERFGRNYPILRHNFSFPFYVIFTFPIMAHFYRENEGRVFSKTSVKLYILEIYNDADTNSKKKQPYYPKLRI